MTKGLLSRIPGRVSEVPEILRQFWGSHVVEAKIVTPQPLSVERTEALRSRASGRGWLVGNISSTPAEYILLLQKWPGPVGGRGLSQEATGRYAREVGTLLREVGVDQSSLSSVSVYSLVDRDTSEWSPDLRVKPSWMSETHWGRIRRAVSGYRCFAPTERVAQAKFQREFPGMPALAMRCISEERANWFANYRVRMLVPDVVIAFAMVVGVLVGYYSHERSLLQGWHFPHTLLSVTSAVAVTANWIVLRRKGRLADDPNVARWARGPVLAVTVFMGIVAPWLAAQGVISAVLLGDELWRSLAGALVAIGIGWVCHRLTWGRGIRWMRPALGLAVLGSVMEICRRGAGWAAADALGVPSGQANISWSALLATGRDGLVQVIFWGIFGLLVWSLADRVSPVAFKTMGLLSLTIAALGLVLMALSSETSVKDVLSGELDTPFPTGFENYCVSAQQDSEVVPKRARTASELVSFLPAEGGGYWRVRPRRVPLVGPEVQRVVEIPDGARVPSHAELSSDRCSY